MIVDNNVIVFDLCLEGMEGRQIMANLQLCNSNMILGFTECLQRFACKVAVFRCTD